jgi:RNA polymerase sigma-70 factor (ECF subfamily)
VPVATVRAEDLAALLRATGEGDALAFARLYRLTVRRLHATVVFLLRGEDRAQDALQEVYLSVWQHARSYASERGPVMTWLVRIARNRALDDMARGPRRGADTGGEALDGIPDPAPSPETLASQHQQARLLCRHLDRLPPMQRACVRCACVDGLSHAEIARRLQVPLGSVKAWIRRGLIRMRRSIGNGDSSPAGAAGRMARGAPPGDPTAQAR